MLTNIRYILLTALRDWLFAGLMIGLLACALISKMLGGTALIENQEMTLAYTSASARVIIMLGLIVFTCFHIRNAFDTKEIDVFLSRPITRANLVFSYWLGFATVSLLLIIPTIILISTQGVINWQGFILWSLSLLIECWLVVAISLLASFAFNSAVTSVIISIGFYVLARMLGFFVATFQDNSIFTIIAKILPRLDLFTKSDWLIYGLKNTNDLKLFAGITIIFIPLLILATIVDFARKQF